MYKTWIELSKKAVKSNIATFRKLVTEKVKILAVVKSNAYGHGLLDFSRLAEQYGVEGFCVDSIIEGIKLRNAGIKKFVLVLGATMTDSFAEAAANDLTVTISNLSALSAWQKAKVRPLIHLKIDTGMHRQGFYVDELKKAITIIKADKRGARALITGVLTHFASAKDINYPTYTNKQLGIFNQALGILERSGFENLMRHAAATSGTLLGKKYHFDAVRIGIGLYGLYPSKELEMQLPELKLEPVLSWKSVISEIKKVAAGKFIGYDLTERLQCNSTVGIVPIGYWHGYSWRLSGIGEVLVGNKRARVLGRVSMDMIAIDLTHTRGKIGTQVVLIGRQVPVEELARKIGTSYYEVITRLNPLIKKIVVN